MGGAARTNPLAIAKRNAPPDTMAAIRRQAEGTIHWSLRVTVAPKPHMLVATPADVRTVDGVTEVMLSMDGKPGAWQPVPEGAKLLVADENGRVTLEPDDSDYVVEVIAAQDASHIVTASGQPLQVSVSLGPIRVGVADLRDAHAKAMRSKP